VKRRKNLWRIADVSARAPHGYTVGNHVAELNDYRRRIIIGVGVIGVARTAGGSGEKTHQAQNRSAQQPVSE
jgi:hypothetical protein